MKQYQRSRNTCERPITNAVLQTSFTIEEIEDALVFVAYIVRLHGPRYAGLMYRLQAELEKAKREDPMVEADRILEEYTQQRNSEALALQHNKGSTKKLLNALN